MMINWHELPPEFKWAAMEIDGEWYAYTEKPIFSEDLGAWVLPSGASFSDENCLNIPSPIDCRATLTRKHSPEDLDNLFKL